MIQMITVEPTGILLVEDDLNDVELIQMALENYNFANDIRVAHDGEEAIHYLIGQEGEPSVQPLPRMVLLDLKLPKVSGIQVLEAIRRNPRTKNLVVIVMTSSAENQDLQACYALGVNSYIVKPLDFQQFVEVCRKVGFYWMLLNHIPLQD